MVSKKSRHRRRNGRLLGIERNAQIYTRFRIGRARVDSLRQSTKTAYGRRGFLETSFPLLHLYAIVGRKARNKPGLTIKPDQRLPMRDFWPNQPREKMVSMTNPVKATGYRVRLFSERLVFAGF